MKKIFVITLAISLAAIVLPSLASAQVAPPESCKMKALSRIDSDNNNIDDCPAVGSSATYTKCYLDGSTTSCPAGVRGSICCVFSTLNYIINWIFFALIIVSVILGVWGGVVIATAAGDPAKLEKGRNWIIFAIIGVAVAILARAIPTFAKLIMGV
jgi:hypothetical protein